MAPSISATSSELRSFSLTLASARRTASSAACSSTSTSAIAMSVKIATCVCETSRKPAPITSSVCLPSCVIRTSPGSSRVIKGTCNGKIPNSPSTPGTTTMSTSPENFLASGVTISSFSLAIRLSVLSFFNFVDAALHVEILLGDIVMFALKNFLKAANRFSKLDVLAGFARKYFCYGKWLTQESLQLASTINGQLIFGTQLVHTQDGYNILKILIPLKHALNTSRDIIMLLPNNFRRQGF